MPVKGSTSVRYNLSLHLKERDTRFVTFSLDTQKFSHIKYHDGSVS